MPADLAVQLSNNPAAALPIVFVAGLLTSLTPCVYPMIPITVALVGGQAGRAGRGRRRGALTLAYVVGLALVYAALGVLAGLTGTLFGAVSTNPWLYFVMGNLLVLAGLMMLDVIPVPVPQRVISRAASVGARGRVSGAFAMGSVSGLVAAPCSAPVMATVLAWVSMTGSALLGFIYLFVFSLGMCALLVAVGVSAGSLARLPRAGMWTLWVKRVFAAVMFAVAEYYFIQMGKLLI
jgi:cytochrome c-type biogenesis protein